MIKYFFVLITLIQAFCWAEIESEKVVILGSGPAGLTAAIYASRAGLSPLMISGNDWGGQIATTSLVENFPGFPEGVDGYELMVYMKEQAEKFGTRFKDVFIEKADLSSIPFALTASDGSVIYCQSLIIASGASPNWLGLPAEKTLLSKGVSTCATCDAFFYKNKEVVVVGGGDTALEEALFLSRFASKVTIVHRRDQLRASKIMQDRAFADPKIHFVWNHVVEDILDVQQDKVTSVLLKNVQTNEAKDYPCDGIFIAIGHKPNSSLFAGQLNLDEKGAIITNEGTTKTNIPGVFAAGDVVDSRYRQAITAAAMGCMAAIDADRFLQGLEQ